MSYYWDNRFLRHLNVENIKYVCEVGARYGDESIKLVSIFKNAYLLSFECNPLTVKHCEKNLASHSNIKFFNFGLGADNETLPFYSYVCDNDGASSFLYRIDGNQSQKQTGYIDIKKLSDILREEQVPYVDILCMDVQGFELNVLKGCGDMLRNIKYIIMEQPKDRDIGYSNCLPIGLHSKYINAPSPEEINQFMTENNFVEIERIQENLLEDNVMYKNSKFD